MPNPRTIFHGALERHTKLQPLSTYKTYKGKPTLWATPSRREAERYAVTSKPHMFKGSSDFVYVHELKNDKRWLHASHAEGHNGGPNDKTLFTTRTIKSTHGYWLDRRSARKNGDVLGLYGFGRLKFVHANRSPGNRTIKPEHKNLPHAHPSFYERHDRSIHTGVAIGAATALAGAGGYYYYRHHKNQIQRVKKNVHNRVDRLFHHSSQLHTA